MSSYSMQKTSWVSAEETGSCTWYHPMTSPPSPVQASSAYYRKLLREWTQYLRCSGSMFKCMYKIPFLFTSRSIFYHQYHACDKRWTLPSP